MRRKREKYVYNPNIPFWQILQFWEKKTKNIRLATEKFMVNPDIKIKIIQKEFDIYAGSIYSHLYRLIRLGYVYAV